MDYQNDFIMPSRDGDYISVAYAIVNDRVILIAIWGREEPYSEWKAVDGRLVKL